MAGISEVARRAGVSRTTVSHVFSGKRPVADATRLRVLAAAQALKYNPDSVARGLATGRSMTIGLVLPTSDDPAILNPTWLMVLEGLSSAASAAGYGFLITSTDSPPATEDSDERPARSTFDGIIVLDPVGRTGRVPGLQAGTPAVTIGRHLGQPGIPWVDTDNLAGMGQLLSHLQAQGFRRPALLSIDAEISYIEDIEQVFRQTLQSRGQEPVIVRSAGLSEIEAYEKAIQLLSGRTPSPDAIVAASDRQAIGVLRAARELGLHVPSDIGIAGQGDTVIARSSRPPLTSIRIHPRDVGAAAVRMLLKLISGQAAGNVTIPADLAVRESTRRRDHNLQVVLATATSRG